MDHFPSINYNGVKWAIATVTHLEEISERPVTIAERTMLATRCIWEEHYMHAMEYVKVKSIQECSTGVAACRSFIGFRTTSSLQTVLKNAGYSPSVLQGTAGRGKPSSRWCRRRVPWRTLATPRPSCRATAGRGKPSSHRWCKRRVPCRTLATTRPSCRSMAGRGKPSSRWCRRRVITLPLAFHYQC